MPLTAVGQNTLGDLVLHVDSVSQAKSQDEFTVTSATTQTLPLGAVVYRAKGATAGVTYVPLTAAGQLVTTNEFAILVGDGYSFQPSVAYTATVAKNSLGIVREAMLKGKLIKDWMITTQGLVLADYNNLKHLLKPQMITVEDTLANATQP